jgi:hypothetical protein
MDNDIWLLIVGVVIIAVVGYLYFSGALNQVTGGGGGSGSGGTQPVNPTITASPTSVNVYNNIISNSYTPNTITVSGSGFTNNGNISLVYTGATNSGISNWGTPTASATGTFSSTITLSTYQAKVGTGTLTATDGATGKLASVNLTFVNTGI